MCESESKWKKYTWFVFNTYCSVVVRFIVLQVYYFFHFISEKTKNRFVSSIFSVFFVIRFVSKRRKARKREYNWLIGWLKRQCNDVTTFEVHKLHVHGRFNRRHHIHKWCLQMNWPLQFSFAFFFPFRLPLCTVGSINVCVCACVCGRWPYGCIKEILTRDGSGIVSFWMVRISRFNEMAKIEKDTVGDGPNTFMCREYIYFIASSAVRILHILYSTESANNAISHLDVYHAHDTNCTTIIMNTLSHMHARRRKHTCIWSSVSRECASVCAMHVCIKYTQ